VQGFSGTCGGRTRKVGKIGDKKKLSRTQGPGKKGNIGGNKVRLASDGGMKISARILKRGSKTRETLQVTE